MRHPLISFFVFAAMALAITDAGRAADGRAKAFSNFGDRVAYYTNIYPRATTYNGVTYYVFQGNPVQGDHDPYIMAYNHRTKTGAGGKKSSARWQCPRQSVGDRVGGWSLANSIGTKHTYPQVLKLSDGDIWLFARN